MTAQLTALVNALTQFAASGGLCVAFSGGVDSALLVKCACDAGLTVHAVTFDSTLQPAREAQAAARQAADYGARHLLLQCDPLADAAVRENTRERCYHCKYALFARLRAYADANGLAVLDGTNADDLGEYRPGLRALRELGIASPLAQLGITKAEVRALAAEIGLDVAKKPSSPCLATRFPYDTTLTPQALAMAGAAEDWLHANGCGETVRARVHGDLLRIETPPAQFAQVTAQARELVTAMRALGFAQVTLDLAGFRSGSFDDK